MIKIQFEYYVLNYNFNNGEIEYYNVFNNIHVQKCTEKEVKKYLRSPKTYESIPYLSDEKIVSGFDGFVRELDRIIMSEEWGRAEYEISCGRAFETDCSNLEKWDCYRQCNPNMEMIAREVVYQYKQAVKESNV